MTQGVTVCFWANTNKINEAEFKSAVKAIERQVKEQVSAFWNTTEYYGLKADFVIAHNLSQVPYGSWLVVIQDTLQFDVYGYHYLTETDTKQSPKNTPYALIRYDENWSLVLSHEVVEMLINPFLNASALTEVDGKKIRLVIEPSDPAQFKDNGYLVDGVLVSDFVTPRYYDLVYVSGTRYSWTGKITKPLELLENGYFSFEYLDRLGYYFQMWKVKGKVFVKDLQAKAVNNWGVTIGVMILVVFFLVLLNNRHES